MRAPCWSAGRAAPDLVRLQGFLARNGYPYTVLDALADEEGRAVVERFGVLPEELPLMVCPDGTVLKRPTDAEAGACLGITPELDPQTVYDVAVVGAGPAGLATAVYARVRGPLGARARPARLRRPGRAPPPGSRTISAFRPASPDWRWPGARSIRRRNSAPRSPFRWRWRGSIAAAASASRRPAAPGTH